MATLPNEQQARTRRIGSHAPGSDRRAEPQGPFGHWLQQAIDRKRLSYARLAQLANDYVKHDTGQASTNSTATVRNWISRWIVPHPDTQRALAAVLGISTRRLEKIVKEHVAKRAEVWAAEQEARDAVARLQTEQQTPKASERRPARPNLRKARRARGWSEHDLAQRIYELGVKAGLDEDDLGVDGRTVGGWELYDRRPKQHYVALLSQALERPPEEIDLPPVVPPHISPGDAPPSSPTPTVPVPSTTAASTWPLQLPALGDAYAERNLIDGERLTFAMAHPSLIDQATIDDLATMTRLYSHHAQSLAPRVIGSAVMDLTKRIGGLLSGSHSDAIRRRLQSLYAENITMAGRLAFWSDDRGQAEELFKLAGKLAVDTNERHLQAVVLAFRADLYSTVPYIGTVPNNTNVALALFQEAAALDAPDTPPMLRSWVYGCRAEEYATLRRASESDRDMERAHAAQAATAKPGIGADQVLDISTLDIAAAAAGLSGFEGACALALGRAREARQAFESGLREQSSIGRTSGLAAAYALEGDIESAADLLTEGLEQAIRRQLPTRRRRVEGVRAAFLSRAQDHPAVQRFDERLRAVIG